MSRFLPFLTSLFLCFALLAPGAVLAKSKGLVIEGFVGQSSTVPAAGVTVKLLDSTGRVLDMDDTNFFGKYKFDGLVPGYYVVQVNSIRRELLMKEDDRKKRLDIDLSAAGGAMNYATGAMAPPAPGAAPKPGAAPRPGSGGLGAPQGGGLGTPQGGGIGSPAGQSGAGGGSGQGQDPNVLIQQMSGRYYGYSGSTETRAVLCPDGAYYDSSESSYSGQGYNSLGDQTMAFGAASQNRAQGRWTAGGTVREGLIIITYSNGNLTRIQYRAIDNAGCYNFNATTMCREGPANCQ